jgi:chromosome segregation ATPase
MRSAVPELVVTLCCLAALAPAGTLAAGEDPAAVTGALERIGRTLDSLVALQRTNLLLQRILLEERRIEPLSDELRRARDEARSFDDEATALKAERERLEESLVEAVRGGREEEAAALREQQGMIDRIVEMHAARVESSRARIQQIELDLDRARRSIRILDERLEKAIDDALEPAPANGRGGPP